MQTIYLSEKETKNIKSIYGLWDFCLENIKQKIYIIVDETV